MMAFHEPSVNSASRPFIQDEIASRKRSLAQSCPNIIYGVITLLILLAIICFLAYDAFTCHTTITDVNITTTAMPGEEEGGGETYLKKQQVFGPNVPGQIRWFWQGNSPFLAIVNCVCSLIWPFVSGIALLPLLFVRFSIKHQQVRSRTLCLVMHSAKIALCLCFCNAFDGIVNYVNRDIASVKLEIISAPSNEYALFTLGCSVFGVITFVLLLIDQFYMYNPAKLRHAKVANQLQYDNHASPVPYFQPIECAYSPKDYVCLFTADTKRSGIGICIKSIYLTLLLMSVWIICEALFTAQVGFSLAGLFPPANTVIIKSAKDIGLTAADYLILTTALQKNLVSTFFIVVVIVPIIVQLMIVIVWLIPLQQRIMKWFIRFIFVLQAVNCIEVYLIAALLCGSVFENYTKWFTSIKGGSDGLCGPDSVVSNELGGCIYAEPFFNHNGVVLMLLACIVQWTTFVYTIRTANKIGLDVLRL